MKLIFCLKCNDLVALKREPRTCQCGQSGGVYVDASVVEIHGPCMPIGIHNKELIWAIRDQFEFGDLKEQFQCEPLGRNVAAWVIPTGSSRIIRTD